MIRVLFVCTGNSCRSPMAEALFKARMPVGWKGLVEVSSAGTAGLEGGPASHFAMVVLREEGIDISAHRTRSLTGEMVERADLIIVMEGRHRDAISRIAPDAAARVIVFGELDGARRETDIEDPIGGDREIYEVTRGELKGLVSRLIDHLVELYGLER